MRRLARGGLTFVELLVAATMMSILFVGLGTHLRGGLTVWHRATTTVEALARERVALELFERDLANAFIYNPQPDAQPEPHFDGATLRWFTVAPTGQGGVPTVQIVTYACVPVDDASWLARSSQSVSEALAQPQRAPTRNLLLRLEECQSFSIAYAYRPAGGVDPDDFEAFEWASQWEGDPQKHELPRLLRVSMQPASRPPITHVFGMPAGVLKDKP